MEASSTVCKCKVTGNKNDAVTATSDAQKVPMTYNLIIGFITEFGSAFCESALMTRTKTKIGATAFNALTKIAPKTFTTEIKGGANSAIKMPTIKPQIINLINAVSP